MPIAKVQLADGRIARLEVPEGTTEQEVMAFAQNVGKAEAPAPQADEFDPTKGMSGYEKFMAGVGKGMVDIGRGVGQMTGFVSQEDIDLAQKEDAPLMNTGLGKAGNIAGSIAVAAPAAFIPGANTAVGATLTGASLGAAQPVATGESRTKNAAFGGIFGAAGHQFGTKVVPAVINKAKQAIASAAANKAANATKDATIASSRQAGYVLPPSEVNPSKISNILERWAGKASVAQQASINNQQVTNKLVREALDLPKDAPITKEALQPIKEAAWKVYEQVKSVGQLSADDQFTKTLNGISKEFNGLAKEFPELGNSGIDDLVTALNKPNISAEGAVEAIKNLRYQAKANLSPINMNPAARSLGKAQIGAANALEELIERNLDPKTLGGLVKDFRNARVSLAKVGTVEKALNETTGDISAKKLASEMAKGKPLTGGLKQAGAFAQAFPRYAQQNVNQVPGGSPLDAALAIGTSAAMSNPGWLALAAGRPAARNLALSKALAREPSYNPGMINKMLAKMPNSKLTPQAMALIAPSIYTAQQ